ncbi:MAG: aspartyl protease family protein [Bacteroidales bacterium]|nr:aspartyl protease family protein [Bacteroidales bacterium]
MQHSRPIRTFITIILLTIIGLSQTSAQKLIRDFSIGRKNFVDTIKIKMWNGAIIIPVEIDGKIKNLMFDTGANTGFWIGEEEDWMAPSGDSITTVDSQNKRKKTAIMKIPSMKIGSLTITDYPLVVADGLSDYTCGINDGALGFDFAVKGISFKFDTKDSLMIVTDRKRFFVKEEKGHLKVKYKHYSKPDPKVWVQFPFVRAKLDFDSGYIGGWFSLPQHLLDIWAKENPQIKQQLDEMTMNVDTTVMTGAGLFGASLDSVVNGELHVPEIGLGDLVFKDVWISTATHKRLIGSAILEHTSLIIDAPKKSFVFLPHNGNYEITAANRGFGMSCILAEAGDTLGAVKVVVRNGTAAYEKGLRTGDYLISVNGVEIPDLCTYILLMRQGKVTNYIFRSPEGTVKEIELE